MIFLKTLARKVWRGMQHSAAALATFGLVAAFVPTTASADGSDFFHNGSGFKGHQGYGVGRGGHQRGHDFHANRGYNARVINRNSYVDRRNYNRGREYHAPRYSSRNYNNYRGYRRNNNGNAIAAGIVGLAAGAIIASELSRSSRRVDSSIHGGSYKPYSPEWYRACARKYRSFNPDTGRYVTYGGERRLCRL